MCDRCHSCECVASSVDSVACVGDRARASMNGAARVGAGTRMTWNSTSALLVAASRGYQSTMSYAVARRRSRRRRRRRRRGVRRP